MANFLLEIGLEEVPAHLVTPAINQVVERAENFMKDERLAYESIKPFSTPRRLAVLISGVAEKAEDFTDCLLYTSPSPRDGLLSRMPSSAWKKKKS